MFHHHVWRKALLLVALLIVCGAPSFAIPGSAANLAAAFEVFLPIVRVPAPAIQLLEPANNDRSSLAPVLSWTLPVKGTYQVQVATDMGFATTVLSKTLKYTDPTVTTGSIPASNSNLSDQTSYFWRVGVLLDSGYAYSPVRTFITPQASKAMLPAPPTVLDATPLTDTVTLSWEAMPNVLFYRVNIDSSAQKVVASALVAAPATTATLSGLTPGTAYTWRVRALSASGWGADATAPTFTTNP